MVRDSLAQLLDNILKRSITEKGFGDPRFNDAVIIFFSSITEVTVLMTGQLVVTKIAPDGPAFQSKEIYPGDILIQVNGTLLEGMTLEQVWSFIMGPPNTRVDLQLLRPNEQQDGDGQAEEIYVSIFRSSVSSPTIPSASEFPRHFSLGQRDVSLPRSSRANSAEVQNVTAYSQMSPSRDQVSTNSIIQH